MMVGIDIVLSSRFKNKTESFFKKYFTENELSYAKTRKNFEESVAGIFALKEAFLKALGIGVFGGVNLLDVEVSHTESGAPVLLVSENVKNKFKLTEFSVSISHDAGMAVAICIVN